jgi:hypothetical protein
MKANRAYNRKTPLPLLDANLLPPATIGAALEQGSIPTPADIVCELPQKRAYKQRTTVAVDPSTAGTPSPKQAGPKRRGRGWGATGLATGAGASNVTIVFLLCFSEYMCYKCNLPLGSCEYMLLLYFTLRLLSLEHNLWGNLFSLVYSVYEHLQVIKVSFYFIQTSRIAHYMNWDTYLRLHCHLSTSSYTSSACFTYYQRKLTSTFCLLSFSNLVSSLIIPCKDTPTVSLISSHTHTCNFNELFIPMHTQSVVLVLYTHIESVVTG